MKVNVKGLAFVGFAAAIFAASAHADTEQEIAAKKKTVTSQYYAEQTYQTKIAGGDNEGKVVVAGATAGSPTYLAFDDTPTANSINLVKSGAIQAAIAATTSNANGRQTASTEDFQVGGASGAWKQIKPDSYIGFANGTGNDAGKALVTINATTDTTLATENEGKLPTASAVKGYVASQINSTIPAGTSGELVTYSGTAGQVGSATLGTGTLTVKQNNVEAGTFSANATNNGTISIVAPSWTAASGTAGYIDNKPGAFTAPTTEGAGTQGFVPAPAANTQTNVLRANGWDTVDTTVTPDSAHLVTSGAVSTAISGAISGANLVQYEEKANILDDDTNKTIATNSSATDKYPSAKAVVTYVGNQINTALPAGTAGNVLTYSGTAGTVNSLAVDTTVGNTSNLVTSGAVNTAINGLLATYIPSGTTCSASNPCALVATGSDSFAWVPMAQSN